jgi:putative transposase
LRKLCEQKGVEIIETEACVDHVHMLMSIPPYLSVAHFMEYLKVKSSLKKILQKIRYALKNI